MAAAAARFLWQLLTLALHGGDRKRRSVPDNIRQEQTDLDGCGGGWGIRVGGGGHYHVNMYFIYNLLVTS